MPLARDFNLSNLQCVMAISFSNMHTEQSSTLAFTMTAALMKPSGYNLA